MPFNIGRWKANLLCQVFGCLQFVHEFSNSFEQVLHHVRQPIL